MAQVTLESKYRADAGKGVARKLRAAGQVPGVLYGPNMEPISLSLNEKSVLQLIQTKGTNRIINLTVEGAPGETSHLCLIKDVTRDVYQTRLVHLDLRKLDLNEKVVVPVRMILEGEDVIRAKGAVVEQMVRAVKVRTKAASIPDSLTLDISEMNLGQTVTIGGLTLPEGVELADNPDMPIMNIFATRGSALAQQQKG